MTEPKPPSHPRGRLARTFLAGVALTVPFIITIAVLWWLGQSIDVLVRKVAPGLRPGLGFLVGLVLGVAIFFLVGLLARVYLVRRLVDLGEWIMLRIPLAKSLYEATRDLMRFFGGEGRQLGSVVRVRLAGGQIQMLGLLTNEHPRGASPPGQGEPGRVSVYLPMSYQLGGFTIYVLPEQVEPLDMSVEEAMKIAAMADVG